MKMAFDALSVELTFTPSEQREYGSQRRSLPRGREQNGPTQIRKTHGIYLVGADCTRLYLHPVIMQAKLDGS